MNDQDELSQVIKMLIVDEETVSRLYHLYSQKFENSDFWSHLSVDESIHAQWIGSLSQYQDQIMVDTSRFTVAVLSTFKEYLDRKIAEVNKVSLLPALAICTDIERALIERYYYKVLKSDSVEVQKIFGELQKAEEQHLLAAEQELNRIKTSKNVV